MYEVIMSLQTVWNNVNGGRRAKDSRIVSIQRTFPSVFDRERCNKEHCSFKVMHSYILPTGFGKSLTFRF